MTKVLNDILINSVGLYAYRKRKQQDILPTVKSSSSESSSSKLTIENVSTEPTGIK